MSMIKMIVIGAIVLTLIRYGVIGTFNILTLSDAFTHEAIEVTLKVVKVIFM